MGRVLLILLVIAAVVLLWMAFKPSTWKRNQQKMGAAPAPKPIKGPDDDEEFLWNIEKNRFKQRRAEEVARREEEERIKRTRERYQEPEGPAEKPVEDDDPQP